MMHIAEQHTDLESNTVEWMHSLLFSTNENSEDNPSWDQAMYGPDREDYWQAMEKELETHQHEKHALDIIDLEHWMIVLPSTWAFKCTRYIDGTIRKLKASFYARADHPIEGVYFFATFAPVINWTAVLMMLIFSIILGESKLIKLITRLHLYIRQLIKIQIGTVFTDGKKKQYGI
jgi:hypothetical protein